MYMKIDKLSKYSINKKLFALNLFNDFGKILINNLMKIYI